jgi:hypothetical protein
MLSPAEVLSCLDLVDGASPASGQWLEQFFTQTKLVAAALRVATRIPPGDMQVCPCCSALPC